MMGRSPWLGRALAAGVIACLAATAYSVLWTTYMVYDDEGYVLLTLRDYALGGGLYDHVYTQYGPFFCAFYRLLHGLGFEFTNEMGRAAALVCWVGTAALCGAIVARETRGSVLAMVGTMGATFAQLWPMTSEPSHPGGFVALLAALFAWGGTHPRFSPMTRGLVVGAIGMMTALTKINVGGFLLVAAAAWWGLSLSTQDRWRWLRWPIAGGLAVVPVLLMHTLLQHGWVQQFASTIAVGAIAAALASPRAGDWRARSWRVVPAILAGIVVLGLTCGYVWSTGTSLRGLLEGVILGPLRHPAAYAAAFTWRTGSLVIALLSLPVALWLTARPPEQRRPFVLVGQFLVLAGYALCATDAVLLDAGDYVLTYGIALAWLFVIPTHAHDENAPARTWLALLLALQALHAYPVAGSQVSWGTFLFVPLAALGLYEARAVSLPRWYLQVGAVAALIVALFPCSRYAKIGWERFAASDRLDLRGAESLRLPAFYTSSLRAVARNAEVNADVLFSVPGLLSFHLWTGLPTPTSANATHWFSLLSPAQQDEIQSKLEQSPRSAFVVQRRLDDFLSGQPVAMDTPLRRWLFATYTRAFSVGGYEFWTRKDRSIAIVNSATWLSGVPDAPSRYRVDLQIAPVAPATVAAISLRRFHGDGTMPQADWQNGNAQFVTVALSPTGEPQGTPQIRRLPFAVSGLTRISIFTNTGPEKFEPASGIVFLYDAAGQKIGEARFMD